MTQTIHIGHSAIGRVGLVLAGLAAMILLGIWGLASSSPVTQRLAALCLLICGSLFVVEALGLLSLPLRITVAPDRLYVRRLLLPFKAEWCHLRAGSEVTISPRHGQAATRIIKLRFRTGDIAIREAAFGRDQAAVLRSTIASACHAVGIELRPVVIENRQRCLDLHLAPPSQRDSATAGHFRLATPRLRQRATLACACLVAAVIAIGIAEYMDANRLIARGVLIAIGGTGVLLCLYLAAYTVLTPTHVIIDAQGLAVRGVAIRVRIPTQFIRGVDSRGSIADGTREAVLTTPDRVITIHQPDSTGTTFAEFEKALRQLVPESPRTDHS